MYYKGLRVRHCQRIFSTFFSDTLVADIAGGDRKRLLPPGDKKLYGHFTPEPSTPYIIPVNNSTPYEPATPTLAQT